jgi:hypothetical protein
MGRMSPIFPGLLLAAALSLLAFMNHPRSIFPGASVTVYSSGGWWA